MIANGTEDARAMVSLAGERDTATQPRAEARESLWPADRRVLVGVLLVALLVRIGALIRTDVIFNDGPVFLRLAAQMQSGQWHAAFAHDQHPGYPLLIRLAQTLFGEPHPAAIAVSMLFGCAAVAALYVFLLQAWDRRVAALGALMLAVNPYAARFSADVRAWSNRLIRILVLLAPSRCYACHMSPFYLPNVPKSLRKALRTCGLYLFAVNPRIG